MKRKNWQNGRVNRVDKAICFGVALSALVALSFGYLSLVKNVVAAGSSTIDNSAQTKPRNSVRKSDAAVDSTSTKSQYAFWREVAVELAKLPATQTLKTLDEADPFGTRAFEKALTEAEEAKGGHLDTAELQRIWPCPSDDKRITLPERRDQSKAARFRQGKGFLFFQHLRKAGGTHFCTLAETNFPKHMVPRYYCMPDYHWPREHKPKRTQQCAGCLHQWTNEEISTNMKSHRIAGNEWDSFDPTRHFDLESVFVTSFRKPLDRALSQFRFECVEERGCRVKDVGEWWKRRRDLYNVYTWTFSDMNGMGKIATSTAPADAAKRGEAVGKALDTVSQFHLVLAMEWLAYAEDPVQKVLGFHDTSVLSKRVRPHNQRKRNDSWIPSEYLTKEQYEFFSVNLALDEILTDAAHRLFIERLVCEDIAA